jgi:predicted Zn finger-like uncharacterized protein
MDKETIRPIKTDSFQVTYWVLEYNCPKCGAGYEIHLEEDSLFIQKEIKCYKCGHEFRIEYD